MKQWLSDPVVLTCSGIILVGLFGLVWAVRKFFSAGTGETKDALDDLVPESPNLGTIDFRAPSLTSQAPVSAASISAAGISKDVAARLDSMTQRLTEMQTVLMKQSAGTVAAGAGGGAPAGGVGQGFSPETIDKLLKIIGNVIQQVDILQKSMNGPKT